MAISTPVFDDSPEKKFLGVVAMTVQVGRFVQFPDGSDNQFAVLVDNREGKHKGVVLQHPLFDKLLAANAPTGKLPDRFEIYRVNADDLPNTPQREEHYRDPLAVDPEGGEYDRQWLAQHGAGQVRGKDTGWIVIVQEAYDTAIGATLTELTARPDPLRRDRLGPDRPGDGRAVGDGEAVEYESVKTEGLGIGKARSQLRECMERHNRPIPNP